MSTGRLALLIAALVALPSAAHANAGTPLMWNSLLELGLSNLIIGLVEGALLIKFLKLPKLRTSILMVAANYCSAWAGCILMNEWVIGSDIQELHTAWKHYWALLFLTFSLTILLEWPFVALALRNDASWWRKSLRASILVQSVTYLFLFGRFWLASDVSLYINADVVPPSSINLPKEVVLYYIAMDANIYKLRLGDRTREWVCDPAPRWEGTLPRDFEHGNRVVVGIPADSARSWHPSVLETERCDISLLEYSKINRLETIVPQERLAAIPITRSKPLLRWHENISFRNAETVAFLGEAIDSSWRIRNSYQPSPGLEFENLESDADFRIAFDTPLAGWPIRNVVLLPKDKVLFQLGIDQICVLDLNTRKLALIAQGFGPLPVIEASQE